MSPDGFDDLTIPLLATASGVPQGQRLLLKAGALQRAILNSANFSSIATDAQGVIQIFNVGAERMLGYAAADVIDTLTPADISDPVELVALAQALSVELSTPIAPGFEALVFKASRGIEDMYELTYIRKDGRRFPAVVSVTALRDEAGAIIGYLLIGTDNTERSEAVAQLRLQSAALNAAANAIVITDREGLVQWVNPAFSQLTGYSGAEAVGKNPRDLVGSGRHEPGFYQNLWNTILAGHVWHGEMINRRKDGSLYPEEQTITPVRNLQGDISHFIAIKQDITDRKRAEEEYRQSAESLRTSEERTRFALQNANVGIWDLDYVTGVMRGSAIFESHLDALPGTFGGTVAAFEACIHPLDRDAMRETIAEAIRSGADFSVQYRILRRDDTIGWLNVIGRFELGAHGAHGGPIRGVGISLDVTDRHNLEEQFQQAQKMEAIGRLAGGVAHDFNNLLTVILGYCELSLESLGQDDWRRADILQIQKAGRRAAGLTQQLLAFSRKQIIEPRLLDLNAIVTDIRGMLERLIGEDVRIVVGLGPDLWPVLADRGQVEQAIMNLSVNARDAMPRGGTLTIHTANVELDAHHPAPHLDVKPYVALTISDTGSGMTPAVRARLFEPFFTTKEPGKGTGLGLATVYGIVTQGGGSIDVFTELGKGTAFKVYFPRADAAQVVAETTASAARPRGGAQTVLVVEDEEGLRELVQRLLQRLGHTVLVAANAAEARRTFDEHPDINLLLTDVVMPDTSGPELTRQLIEQRPDLRVIYMSGYTEDAIVHHGVLESGIAFLHKPFTSETLGAKIREVLER